MTYVKAIHSESPGIVCCKRGHECLFPNALGFYYNWGDISDHMKAGIHSDFSHEKRLKDQLSQIYPDAEFISPSRHGWHDRHDYAKHTFIPKVNFPLGLQADVVITPRNRQVDANRNWKPEHWQYLINSLNERGISVAVCGARDSTFKLDGAKYYSYEHVDVESDVELMLNAKLVITQESGLQYLSFLCERPTFCIGNYMGDLGSDLHRPMHVPFKALGQDVVADPALLVKEVEFFFKMMEYKQI